MKEQPKLMDASRMRGIFESHLAQYRENCYFDNEIGILYGVTMKSASLTAI